MANFSASSGAMSLGYSLDWTLAFDDAADTVVIEALYTQPPNGVIPVPWRARLTIILNTSVDATVDLITGLLVPSGVPFVQDSPGNMLNAGPKTRTGVKLKVSADRAAAISHSTEFFPLEPT